MTRKLFDIVTVNGESGTIVETYGDEAVEVEFIDHETGKTTSVRTIPIKELDDEE